MPYLYNNCVHLCYNSLNMNAYIDESGDLGVSNKSSKYFILTAFIISEKDAEKLEKEMRKYLRSLFKIHKKRSHYFHAYKENRQTKMNLLKIINKYSYDIKFSLVKKGIRNPIYEKEISVFINNISNNLDRITLSKYETRKNINQNILTLKEEEFIRIEENSKNFLLQVADLFSWIVFNKYEFGKDEYFKCIKSIEKQNL